MICGDPDSGDLYVGVVVKDLPEWATAENPVCCIKAMLRYPMQHTVIRADVAHERPPLKEGGLYSLRVFERLEDGAEAPEDWDAGVRAALARALEACGPPDREILERHRRGDVRGIRAVKSWKEWEL